MMNAARKTIIGLCLLACTSGFVSANPLDIPDFNFNPALMSVRNRTIFELGVSADMMLTNSALGLDDIFTSELVLDFNQIADDLAGGDWMVNSAVSAETHLVLTLFGIDFGVYAGVDGVISLGIPGSLIDLLANGNDIDLGSSGSSDVYARVFYGSGIYAGYRFKGFQFGARVGMFGPLIYTSPDASIEYALETDSDTGAISATADMNIPFYSAVDFENISTDDIIDGMNGVNISIGAVKVKNKKAMYGLSISGITVKPAVAQYRTETTAHAEASIDNIINNIDADNEDWITDEFTDPVFETEADNSYEISTPIQVGGFYRLSGFPKFIDWIAHAELTFDDDVQLRAGVTAEGGFFPLSWFSLGLEYNRVYWNAVLGLKANLRVIELCVNIGTTAPEIQHLLSGNGLYAKFYLGLGF
ncbi:MAG: hypothetical protein JW874_09870 [Spirochaetales bacterium]|nr:hypothetical protein [Spirochaetales bacterium]